MAKRQDMHKEPIMGVACPAVPGNWYEWLRSLTHGGLFVFSSQGKFSN